MTDLFVYATWVAATILIVLIGLYGLGYFRRCPSCGSRLTTFSSRVVEVGGKTFAQYSQKCHKCGLEETTHNISRD